MMQRLDGKMAAVARVLDAPWLGDVDPCLLAIEEILIRIIERADEAVTVERPSPTP